MPDRSPGVYRPAESTFAAEVESSRRLIEIAGAAAAFSLSVFCSIRFSQAGLPSDGSAVQVLTTAANIEVARLCLSGLVAFVWFFYTVSSIEIAAKWLDPDKDLVAAARRTIPPFVYISFIVLKTGSVALMLSASRHDVLFAAAASAFALLSLLLNIYASFALGQACRDSKVHIESLKESLSQAAQTGDSRAQIELARLQDAQAGVEEIHHYYSSWTSFLRPFTTLTLVATSQILASCEVISQENSNAVVLIVLAASIAFVVIRFERYARRVASAELRFVYRTRLARSP